MPQFESLDDLFKHWQKSADKASMLKKLRDLSDERKKVFQEPFQKRLTDYADRHGGPNSLTADVRDEIWREFKPQSDALDSWYKGKVEEVLEFFGRNS